MTLGTANIVGFLIILLLGEPSKIKLSPVLREASATVIPTSTCRREYLGSVSGNHICTKNPFVRPEDAQTTAQSVTTTVSTDIEESTAQVVVEAADDSELQYESPCHGDSGGPLLAEFLENHPEDGPSPNKAGSSMHECVNARQNGGDSIKQPHDTACQRPKDSNEKWYVQVGVLSFGSRVCGQKTPVAYTRITAYLQWIAYITGKHG